MTIVLSVPSLLRLKLPISHRIMWYALCSVVFRTVILISFPVDISRRMMIDSYSGMNHFSIVYFDAGVFVGSTAWVFKERTRPLSSRQVLMWWFRLVGTKHLPDPWAFANSCYCKMALKNKNSNCGTLSKILFWGMCLSMALGYGCLLPAYDHMIQGCNSRTQRMI